MSRRRFSEQRNHFESLEARLALAGNVAAAVAGGILSINGDSAANSLLIEQTGVDTFKIIGLGTKVNGSNSAQTFTGVTSDIDMTLNGGNDTATLKNFNSPELELIADMGTGTNVLTMTGIHVGFAEAGGETAGQTVAIDSSSFNFGLEVFGDEGTGTNAFVITRTTITDGLGVFGGDGKDAVTISQTTVNGGLLVELGNGTNSLAMVNDQILMNEETPDITPFQEDEFDIPDCGAIITGGTGTDAISMTGVTINCFTQIDTSSGNDSVVIANSTFGNTLTDISPPEITPEVIDPSLSDTSGLYIETSTGNDVTAIANTHVVGTLLVDSSDQFAPDGSLSFPETLVKDGNDTVTLTKVTVTNALPPETEVTSDLQLYTGTLLVATGNGSDTVALSFVNTDAPAGILTTDLTSFDPDSSSSLDGADTVSITNSSFNKLDFTFATISATVAEEELTVGLAVITGNGNDTVVIASVNVQEDAFVNTGAGTDKVTVNALTADEIYIELGDGNNDLLTITKSKADEAEFFGGGNPGDSLVKASNQFGSEIDQGFQFINGKKQA